MEQRQGPKVDLAFGKFLEGLSDEAAGKLLKSYLIDSCHGSWDGYASRDLTGIRRLFQDIMIYHRNQ